MKYQPYLFNYNIPAENHVTERPDGYLSLIAEFINAYDGKAHSLVRMVNTCLHEVSQVKNWSAATREIEDIANQHFQRLLDLDIKLKAEDTLRRLGRVVEVPEGSYSSIA